MTLLHQPSGLNDRFYGESLPFLDYIDTMRNIIIEARLDLNQDNAAQIVQANAPFCMEPQSDGLARKTGVLLIHGLFDSPFYMRDIGLYFSRQGYLVKSILLPGHGTVPGDLLTMHYAEWQKAVHYGLTSLASECDEVSLAGYSLGGALAIDAALTHREFNLQRLFLFAPAIKPRHMFKAHLAKYHTLLSSLFSAARWYQRQSSNSFIKYNSYAFNAANQACELMRIIRQRLKREKIPIPMYVALTSDDETVCAQASLSFFRKQYHPLSQLMLYTNRDQIFPDTRVIQKSSHYPGLKILNFSHSCLTISPENALLGAHLYPQKDNFLGAMTRANLKHPALSRLSYNPDFENLLSQMGYFLTSTRPDNPTTSRTDPVEEVM